VEDSTQKIKKNEHLERERGLCFEERDQELIEVNIESKSKFHIKILKDDVPTIFFFK